MRLILAACAFATFAMQMINSPPVRAAEFRQLSDGSPTDVNKSFTSLDRRGIWIAMDGDLERGDADKLASLLRQTSGADGDTARFNLILNSNGGNFTEALELSDRFTYGAFILAGKSCYSACGIIFMAGRRGDAQPDRQMHAEAKLGFHAPFLPAIRGTFTRKTLTTASIVGMKASVGLFERQKKFTLSDQWINAMLSKGPESFVEVTHVHHTIEFDIPVFGMPMPRVRPEILVANLCINQRDDEAKIDAKLTTLQQLERSGRPSAKTIRWHADEVRNAANEVKRSGGTYAIDTTLNEMTGQTCTASITASGSNLVAIKRKYSAYFRSVGSGIYLLHSRWARLSTGGAPGPGTRSAKCGWYAISFCSKDLASSESAAGRYGGFAIATDDPSYPNFRNGWHCAVNGPMTKRRARRERRAQRRRGAGSAYIKKSC